MAVKALGRIDPYFSSYVINAIIKGYCKISAIDMTNTLRENPNLIIYSILAGDLKKLQINTSEHLFNKDKYKVYTKALIDKKLNDLSFIWKYLYYSQITQNLNSLYYLEKLLIQSLNYQNTRNQAIIHLNILYDGVDWELSEPFIPKVISSGSYFVIEESVISEEPLHEVIIILNAPSFVNTCSLSILTWHPTIAQPGNGSNEYVIEKNFGKFWRCGFYDWRIIAINNLGNMRLLKTAMNCEGRRFAQGRYIVQPYDILDQQVHETDCDETLLSSDLTEYLQQGITSVYIKQSSIKKAVNIASEELKIRRSFSYSTEEPSTATKDNKQVSELVKKCKELGLKVFIDYSACTNSEHDKEMYINKLFHCVDNEDEDNPCFEIHNELDKLNNKKLKRLNSQLNRIIAFVKEYNIDGMYIDKDQFLLQTINPIENDINQKNNSTMLYFSKECSNVRNTQTYADPILVKLCKKVWSEFPQYYIISQCNPPFENAQEISRSGVIPHLLKIPIITFLKNHQKNTATHSQSISALKSWYEQHNKLPQGSFLLQSLASRIEYIDKTMLPELSVLFLVREIPVTVSTRVKDKVLAINILQENSVPKNILKTKSRSNLTPNMRVQMANEEGKGSLCIGSERQSSLTTQVNFSSKGIIVHCEKLRKLRHDRTVFRHGEFVLLNTNDLESHVFTFARFSYYEIAIVAINFGKLEVSFVISFSELMPYLMKYYNAHTIVTITDWFREVSKNYCFIMEFVNERRTLTLPAFGSTCIGIQMCKNDPTIYLNCLEQSFIRLNTQLLNGNDCSFTQPCQELLLACQYNQSLNEFAMILANLFKNYICPYSLSIHMLMTNCKYITDNTVLGARFFAYCKKLAAYNDDNMLLGVQSAVRASKELTATSKIGPIVFIAPELGRWSSVGGLGVMVDELTQGLAALGEDVTVITPYYHINRNNETDYLSKDPTFISTKNLVIKVAEITYNIKVYKGKVNNVKIVFLCNSELFPMVYSEGDATHILRQIVGFAKASIEYLSSERIPSIIATNDWYSGLVAAYKTNAFKSTVFVHICHNLQELYEGRLYPSSSENTLSNIHELPSNLLIDFSWNNLIINPSRCALLCSDQWATVSHSYKEELLASSPLASLLKKFPKPFSFPNGIPVDVRLKRLRNDAGLDHEAAKRRLQMKYFHYKDIESSVPVLSFIGRIVAQKGVHLICEVAEQLITKYKGKINIFVGGVASRKDPYSSQCASKLEQLAKTYPNSFWASPDEFCVDGPLINLGSDFGIMPSVFEPGGIVQHEFFLAGTPVIAFKIGGLKDAITNFKSETNEGNGFLFELHNKKDFMTVIEKALKVFFNKEKYLILRKNAEKSVMDGIIVAKEWCKEFYRLKGKVYVDKRLLKEEYGKINTEWDYTIYNDDYIDEYIYKDVLGIDSREEMKKFIPIGELIGRWVKRSLIAIAFKISLGNKQVHMVQLAGSFNEWNPIHKLKYNKSLNTWSISLQLKKGKYL